MQPFLIAGQPNHFDSSKPLGSVGSPPPGGLCNDGRLPFGIVNPLQENVHRLWVPFSVARGFDAAPVKFIHDPTNGYHPILSNLPNDWL